MGTWLNVLLQAAALVVFTWLRMTTKGWNTLALVLYGTPVLMVTLLVLAIVMARRKRRPDGWTLAVFTGSAVAVMVAGGLISDQDDNPGWMIPILMVFGQGRVDLADSPWLVLDTIGWWALVAYLVCFIAACVLFAVRRPASESSHGGATRGL